MIRAIEARTPPNFADADNIRISYVMVVRRTCNRVSNTYHAYCSLRPFPTNTKNVRNCDEKT